MQSDNKAQELDKPFTLSSTMEVIFKNFWRGQKKIGVIPMIIGQLLWDRFDEHNASNSHMLKYQMEQSLVDWQQFSQV